MIEVPDAFAARMVEMQGEAGAAWLARLPSLVGELAARWDLTLLPPFEPLSYNYVAPAMRADSTHAGGSDAVLKVGFIQPELLTEIEALRLYDGRGIARLLAADPERGALLLERLRPGRMLATLEDDQEATSIAAGVMQALWCPLPPDHPFPTVALWAAGFQRLRAQYGGGTGPLPRAWVERAEGLFADLIASMEEPVLLHGDLHHYNILSAERQTWLALDPKGVAGEPAYEVGALLRNPWPGILQAPNLHQMQARRVDQLAGELGFDRARLVGWSVAQAVLSAWWALEDHASDWQPWIACAEILAAIG